MNLWAHLNWTVTKLCSSGHFQYSYLNHQFQLSFHICKINHKWLRILISSSVYSMSLTTGGRYVQGISVLFDEVLKWWFLYLDQGVEFLRVFVFSGTWSSTGPRPQFVFESSGFNFYLAGPALMLYLVALTLRLHLLVLLTRIGNNKCQRLRIMLLSCYLCCCLIPL